MVLGIVAYLQDSGTLLYYKSLATGFGLTSSALTKGIDAEMDAMAIASACYAFRSSSDRPLSEIALPSAFSESGPGSAAEAGVGPAALLLFARGALLEVVVVTTDRVPLPLVQRVVETIESEIRDPAVCQLQRRALKRIEMGLADVVSRMVTHLVIDAVCAALRPIAETTLLLFFSRDFTKEVVRAVPWSPVLEVVSTGNAATQQRAAAAVPTGVAPAMAQPAKAPEGSAYRRSLMSGWRTGTGRDTQKISPDRTGPSLHMADYWIPFSRVVLCKQPAPSGGVSGISLVDQDVQQWDTWTGLLSLVPACSRIVSVIDAPADVFHMALTFDQDIVRMWSHAHFHVVERRPRRFASMELLSPKCLERCTRLVVAYLQAFSPVAPQHAIKE